MLSHTFVMPLLSSPMPFPSTIIPVVATLLGTALGGLLTQLHTWRATQQVDKRILRECLYPLLELQYLLQQAAQVKGLTQEIIRALQKQFPNAPVEELNRAQEILPAFVMPHIVQEMQQLKEVFNASLIKLAGVDPISAYELRGRESSITQISAYADSVTEKIRELAKPEEQEQTVQELKKMYPVLEQATVDKALERVEAVLLHIAKRIDTDTYLATQQAIHRRQAGSAERKQDIEKYMQQIMPLFMQQ